MSLKKGVYQAAQKDGSMYFRASITYRNKHISLGSFMDEESAHKAYLLANEILFEGKYHFDDSVPHPSFRFDKWIALHNFRDNGYYFKNPIYLHKTYFTYFLEPKLELDFDVDDLFYYSNHKIFRRNGYFFVNDYGSQINILSRYGIKNFATVNKDYYFKDANPHNLRYDNIVIINKYNGVTRLNKEVPVYLARIHLHGNFTIGKYHSEIKAAIAFNKAADYVNQMNFCNKRFERNYIEEIDANEYKRIYEGIKLPPKILLYFSKRKS